MTGSFSCTLKFIVKDCDPNTGEADDDGYEDEYVVSSTCMSCNSTPLNTHRNRIVYCVILPVCTMIGLYKP